MKKKIIILIIIVVITLITTILLLNSKTNTIQAKILVVESDYLLVSTDDNLDYIIKTTNTNYVIGDKLKLEIKNINSKKTPYEATAKNISVISPSSVKDTDLKEETSNKDDSNNEQLKTENITSQKEEISSETDIINYFEDLNTKLKNYNNQHNIGKEIKSKFVTCIDFLFYDKEIGGKTFKELTNNTKLKILELTMFIDSKIDSVFPGYKDSITTKYQDIKSKVIELYLNTTTDICNSDKNLCETAKKGFSNLKDSFGITWEIIKNLASQGISKLKDWYEIWRYN